MSRRNRQVSTAEVEALQRRYNQAMSHGVDIPNDCREKYQRLENITGDPTYYAEAAQIAIELFAFFEARQPRAMDRRSRGSTDGRVEVSLEPATLDALDRFIADEESVSSRPEAIQMILDQLLTGGTMPSLVSRAA